MERDLYAAFPREVAEAISNSIQVGFDAFLGRFRVEFEGRMAWNWSCLVPKARLFAWVSWRAAIASRQELVQTCLAVRRELINYKKPLDLAWQRPLGCCFEPQNASFPIAQACQSPYNGFQ